MNFLIFFILINTLGCNKLVNNFNHKDKIKNEQQIDRNVSLHFYVKQGTLRSRTEYPDIYVAKVLELSKRNDVLEMKKMSTIANKREDKNIYLSYEIEGLDNPDVIEVSREDNIFEVSYRVKVDDRRSRQIIEKATSIDIEIDFNLSKEEIVSQMKEKIERLKNKDKSLVIDEIFDRIHKTHILNFLLKQEEVIEWIKQEESRISEDLFHDTFKENEIATLDNGNKAIVLKRADQQIDDKEREYYIVFFKFFNGELEILDIYIKKIYSKTRIGKEEKKVRFKERDIEKIKEEMFLEIKDKKIYLSNIKKEVEVKALGINNILDFELRCSGIQEYIFDKESIEDQIGTTNYIKLGPNMYAFVAKGTSINIKKDIWVKEKIEGKSKREWVKKNVNISNTTNDIMEANLYVSTFELDARGRVKILDMACLIRDEEDEAVYSDDDSPVKLRKEGDNLIVDFVTNVLSLEETGEGAVFKYIPVSSDNASDKRSITELCRKRYLLELVDELKKHFLKEDILTKIEDIVEKCSKISKKQYDYLSLLIGEILDKYEAKIEAKEIKENLETLIDKFEKDSENEKAIQSGKELISSIEKMEKIIAKLEKEIEELESDLVINDNKIGDMEFNPDIDNEKEREVEELINFKSGCDEVRRYLKNKNIVNIYDTKKMRKALREEASTTYQRVKDSLPTRESLKNRASKVIEKGSTLLSEIPEQARQIKQYKVKKEDIIQIPSKVIERAYSLGSYAHNLIPSFPKIDKCHDTNQTINGKQIIESRDGVLRKSDEVIYEKLDLTNEEINERYGIAKMHICYESAQFTLDQAGNLRAGARGKKKEDQKRIMQEVGSNIFDPKITLADAKIIRVFPLPD